MPRHESDKEDLFAEATALVDRAEYSREPDHGQRTAWQVVTLGFRDDESFSVYFEQDLFYQFDSTGLLRRAYQDGFLFRSQGATLARLQRQRSSQRTTLQRADLTKSELAAFHQCMRNHLSELRESLGNGTAQRLRSVTERNNFDEQVVECVDMILCNDSDFLSSSINMRK